MAKIIAFHGSDNKVGTTMIAQSAAEILAEGMKDKKILFVVFTNKENCEYTDNENYFITDFKTKMENKNLKAEHILSNSFKNENLYFIGGIADVESSRDYFPRHGEFFLEKAKEIFDVIVIDTGSEVDQGLALAGLIQADLRCLVITQQETAIKAQEKKEIFFSSTNINIKKLIINKFIEGDSFTCEYIKERLNFFENEGIETIKYLDNYRDAERKKKTFVNLNILFYRKYIENILEKILKELDIKADLSGRKRLWKSFI